MSSKARKRSMLFKVPIYKRPKAAYMLILVRPLV